MKLLNRPRAHEAREGLDVTALFPSMLDKAASNIMFADTDFTIRYINEASRLTLHKIAHLLPVAPEKVLGSSIDIFHKSP